MNRMAFPFLCLNVALGLVFAFWAYGIYANHVDPKPESDARQKQIADLGKAIGVAEKTWHDATELLQKTEARKPELAAWYKQQLDNLQQGTQPITAVAYTKGQLQLSQDGKVVMGPVVDAANKPIPGLKSIKALNLDYDNTQKEIRVVLEETTKLIDEEKRLTTQIGEGRAGLRGVLAAEQQQEKRSLDEQEFLRPLLYNRQVEALSLVERRKVLEDRLKELQAAP